MNKFAISIFAIGAVLFTSTVPIFANVVRSSTGHPVEAYSNPGSSQGLLHRSSTGTLNKTTHDGAKPIIDEG